MASALIAANEPEQGHAQLAAVAQAAEAAPTADLRAYYLESLIRAYAEVGDFEQALNLLNRSFPVTSHDCPVKVGVLDRGFLLALLGP
jgi:hypothetical protein